jgi:uridine kinase
MTSLCYDNHSRINPSDLRLIRRIVRDRHQRDCKPEDNIKRWKSVRRGEQKYIFPYVDSANIIFDTSLIYELSVLKVFAERYLLEVPQENESFPTAYRLCNLLKNFVAIYPDHVPQNSIVREFIGGSSFDY